MNALIHWPEWAKLARIAGRSRAKARRGTDDRVRVVEVSNA